MPKMTQLRSRSTKRSGNLLKITQLRGRSTAVRKLRPMFT